MKRFICFTEGVQVGQQGKLNLKQRSVKFEVEKAWIAAGQAACFRGTA